MEFKTRALCDALLHGIAGAFLFYVGGLLAVAVGVCLMLWNFKDGYRRGVDAARSRNKGST